MHEFHTSKMMFEFSLEFINMVMVKGITPPSHDQYPDISRQISMLFNSR